MALKVGELFATIDLDNKGFNQGVDQSGSRFSGLAKGVAKGGIVIVGALAAAGAAAGAMGLKLGGMASDVNEAMSKVQVVFGDTGDEIIAWSEDAARALGMSQGAALAAAGTYGNLFRSMGMTERASADMSTGLIELAADLASFNNMDPTEVLEKLRAGLTGETEPLKALGVNLSAAAIEAQAMEMGLAGATGELDASAKAQASYALIMEQTALAQGDFARTSDGMANQQRILGATMEDAMAKLGQAVVPIIESILPGLVAALSGVSAWATENAPAIQETITGIFTVIGDVVAWFVSEVWPTLVAGFGVFVDEILPRVAAGVGFLADDVFPAVSGAIGLIVDNLDILMPAFAAMAAMIVAAVIPSFVAWAVAAGAAAVATVIALAPVVVPILAIGAAVVALGLIWREWGDDISRIIGNVGDTIRDAFAGIGRFFTGVWDGISGAFKSGLNVVIGMINGFLRFLNSLRINIPSIDVPLVGRLGGGAIDPFNFGMIPRLGSGGRILRDGLALIGEEGPELMHMRAGAQVTPLGGDGLGGNVTVQMTVQPREVVDVYDIGLEARRAVYFGLRRRTTLQGERG